MCSHAYQMRARAYKIYSQETKLSWRNMKKYRRAMQKQQPNKQSPFKGRDNRKKKNQTKLIITKS